MFWRLTNWPLSLALAYAMSPSLLLAESPKAESSSLSIFIKADDLNTPSARKVQVDPRICGKEKTERSVLLGSKKELANVVISATPVHGPAPQWNSNPPPKIPMKIHGCEFNPRILVVPPTATISVQSEDQALFHLRTISKKNKKWTRALPQNLARAEFSLQESEIVGLVCDMHPWMKSYIVVAPHPLYQITDEQGQATFDSVPYGEYRIQLWHEVLGNKELPQTIVIGDKDKEIDFLWKFEDAPEPVKTKPGK